MSDTKTVCAEIMAGDHDLAEIALAIQGCVSSGKRSLRWYFDLDAIPDDRLTGSFDDGDLTLDEAELVERWTKKSWFEIDPAQSSMVAKPLLTICYRRVGLDDDEAVEAAGQLRSEDVVKAIKQREVRPADPT